MPIYEYACDNCGHEFEVEQRMSDDPVKKCPVCEALKVKRLISKTSFVLKGGGWYSDLYSSQKPGEDKKEAKGDSDSSSSDTKKSDKKSDKKSSGDKPDKGKSKAKSKGKGKAA
ncbi:MAG: zinc ribbon domain-containing protein [Myxococcota bacterium]